MKNIDPSDFLHFCLFSTAPRNEARSANDHDFMIYETKEFFPRSLHTGHCRTQSLHIQRVLLVARGRSSGSNCFNACTFSDFFWFLGFFLQGVNGIDAVLILSFSCGSMRATLWMLHAFFGTGLHSKNKKLCGRTFPPRLLFDYRADMMNNIVDGTVHMCVCGEQGIARHGL